MLNLHYAAVSRESTPLDLADVTTIINRPLLNTLPSLFEFSPITHIDIDLAFQKSTKNCTGPDCISMKMLKLVYPVLRPHLYELFYQSIEQGVFPDAWKFAAILPLSKSHPPYSPSDTRPIALLPELSKLFERVVNTQLLKYLIDWQLLDPRQSCFRAHHSTQTALLGFTEHVRQAIDQRMVTIQVLFDFSKAFDYVSHRLILEKLQALNCSSRVIKWFASYESGRSQSVCGDDDSFSEPILSF